MKNYTIQITFEAEARDDEDADKLAGIIAWNAQEVYNLYGYTIDEVWPCEEDAE